MKTIKFSKNQRQFLINAFIICSILSITIIYFLNLILPNKTTENIATTVAGILGTAFSFFGSILVYRALQSQIKANKIISEQFKIQKFESQFYEMLRLHKENINEMNITGYYNSVQHSYEYFKGDIITTITKSQSDKIISGRKVFVSMVNELIFCCDFCVELNNANGEKYEKNKMIRLGYRIFFHGSNSEFLIDKDFKEKDFIKLIRLELRKVRKEHKRTNGEYNYHFVNGKKIMLPIKYSPFTGHVSRLGHYYRHLFYIVKFVVENENKELFNYQKSREYLKLLRAQMSNDEQLLLYYNFKIGFGEEWENENNNFFSKYRMLHNLPTGKVKYSNPLIVFKKQIDQIKIDTDGKEEMFEWGDK